MKIEPGNTIAKEKLNSLKWSSKTSQRQQRLREKQKLYGNLREKNNDSGKMSVDSSKIIETIEDDNNNSKTTPPPPKTIPSSKVETLKTTTISNDSTSNSKSSTTSKVTSTNDSISNQSSLPTLSDNELKRCVERHGIPSSSAQFSLVHNDIFLSGVDKTLQIEIFWKFLRFFADI